MNLEGRGSEDMFMRILSRAAGESAKKKPKKECPYCGREIAVFKSGRFYAHKCKASDE